MNADELAAAFGAAAAHELESALDRIKHCLGQLTDGQVWHRSQPGLNSIGNSDPAPVRQPAAVGRGRRRRCPRRSQQSRRIC